MLGSPYSQENIAKIQYVRQSIVTRDYYKNLSKLDNPQSQEHITSIKVSQIVHGHMRVLQKFK